MRNAYVLGVTSVTLENAVVDRVPVPCFIGPVTAAEAEAIFRHHKIIEAFITANSGNYTHLVATVGDLNPAPHLRARHDGLDSYTLSLDVLIPMMKQASLQGYGVNKAMRESLPDNALARAVFQGVEAQLDEFSTLFTELERAQREFSHSKSTGGLPCPPIPTRIVTKPSSDITL